MTEPPTTPCFARSAANTAPDRPSRAGRAARIAVALTFIAPAWAGTPELQADVASCLVKPKQVVQLGSPVFGALAKVFVDRAQRVQEGQVVAKLDTTLEEAQMALDRAKAANTTQIDSGRVDLAMNQRELERRQKLAGNMFSKANEIDEITTKIEQDKIAIRRAEADLRVAELEADRSEAQYKMKLIRSPVNGAVSEIKLSPGEFIYEQTPIMTLVQLDPLYVDLVVPAERYGALRTGMTAELRLLPPVNRVVSATIDVVDPVIDVGSDTFRVRLVVPNADYAIPAGVRCAARFPEVHDE